MRAFELFESRGVTARAQGETYTSTTDKNDILTIQNVITIPDGIEAYETVDDLKTSLDELIPQDSNRIDDNNSSSGSKAAIVAIVTNVNGEIQHWVRYIKRIPPQGVHTLWLTLRGYKFSQGAEKESLAIKPTDLIKDERFRSTDQLSQELIRGVQELAAKNNTPELATVIETAIKLARGGKVEPIPNANQFYNVLQKYGGEYLGPLAIIDGGFKNGDTVKMLKAFGLKSLSGSTISFPQSAAMELIDSIILTPDKQRIQISSKISTGGGASSSLHGVVKQLTPEIEKRFPEGSHIMRLLGTESSVDGPIKVAQLFNIIDNDDVRAFKMLNKKTKNIGDLTSDRLIELTRAQGYSKNPAKTKDYRVFFHTLTAIMYSMMREVNNHTDWKNAMLAALNNNNYVQVVTKGKQHGDDVSLDYYTKFPAVFKGGPQLVNKSYFASGQKGRIGFKLI